jgi:hypothetical protein
MTSWPYAFALTTLIEVPIVVALTSGRLSRRLLVAVAAQLATHPLLWFYFARLPGVTGRTGVLIGELFALVAEAVIYRLGLPDISAKRALGLSALANGTSLAVGLLVRT